MPNRQRFILMVTVLIAFSACHSLLEDQLAEIFTNSTNPTVMPPHPPESCEVTALPPVLFVPPPPYPPRAPFGFWYGTDELWTELPFDGIWSALPYHQDGYSQKVFFANKDYFWLDEPEPQLMVTGRRLDEPAPALLAHRATNAFTEDMQSAILVGVSFPTLGCWEITGRYKGNELTFVIWIAP